MKQVFEERHLLPSESEVVRDLCAGNIENMILDEQGRGYRTFESAIRAVGKSLYRKLYPDHIEWIGKFKDQILFCNPSTISKFKFPEKIYHLSYEEFYADLIKDHDEYGFTRTLYDLYVSGKNILLSEYDPNYQILRLQHWSDYFDFHDAIRRLFGYDEFRKRCERDENEALSVNTPSVSLQYAIVLHDMAVLHKMTRLYGFMFDMYMDSSDLECINIIDQNLSCLLDSTNYTAITRLSTWLIYCSSNIPNSKPIQEV